MFRIKLAPRNHSDAGNVAVRMRKVGGKTEGNRVEADLHNRNCDWGDLEFILHRYCLNNVRLRGRGRLQEFAQMPDFIDPGVSLDNEIGPFLIAVTAQLLKEEPISVLACRFI